MLDVLDLFDPRDHYWVVAGSKTQVYSSARAAYVAVGDASYQAWLTTGRLPTRIASEDELMDVLAAQYPAGLLATSAQAQIASVRRLATEALQAIDWQAKLNAVNAGQTLIADLDTRIAAVNAATTLAQVKAPLVTALTDERQILTGLLTEATDNLRRWRKLLQTFALTNDQTVDGV